MTFDPIDVPALNSWRLMSNSFNSRRFEQHRTKSIEKSNDFRTITFSSYGTLVTPDFIVNSFHYYQNVSIAHLLIDSLTNCQINYNSYSTLQLSF